MENWNVREHENTHNMQIHVKNSNYSLQYLAFSVINFYLEETLFQKYKLKLNK